MGMTLRELRKQKGLTQAECAAYLGVAFRTYQNYETDISKQPSIKYAYMMEKLQQFGFVDESHGILTIEGIKETCNNLFTEYGVDFCYLFGSYAKGTASETSDVDLLISSSVLGMRFYELVETLREQLKKKVDLLTVDQLSNNTDLINEVLKDGIKIYG